MSRSQEHEIEIRAPVEDVWDAIASPEGLTRWFVEEARVEPGPGGRVRVSWGEGMEPAEGSRYAGDGLEGDVVTAVPGSALQLTLDPLDRGLLTLSFEGDTAWFTVATFGEAGSEAADGLAARLRDALARGA